MLKSLLWIVHITLVLAACQSVPPAKPVPQASICPDGRWLVANIWSYDSLPSSIQKEVAKMAAVAKSRDTRGATSLAAYQGDAVSRTLGAKLRKEVQVRAPVSLNLEVFYRDPRDIRTARVAYNLGVMRVESGTGSIRLPDDPHKWIVEVVWPSDFISPIWSGGKNRLWVPPDDWEGGRYCSMNVHGIVP